jgi:hypothetical protein
MFQGDFCNYCTPADRRRGHLTLPVGPDTIHVSKYNAPPGPVTVSDAATRLR